MSEIDYEELIRSPLDDLEQAKLGTWSFALLGVLTGLAMGALVIAGSGSDASDEPASTSVAPTTSITATETLTPDYPAGFFEISPGLSARANEIILDDEVIAVAFTTAVIRGEDPAEASWPAGGSWLLTSESGTTSESSRVVVGRFSPGAFSVQFPAAAFNAEIEFAEVSVVERWDTETFSGTVSIPFDGEPFVAPQPVSIPVNQDVTLILTNLELGRFLGAAEWEVVGGEIGTTVQIRATLLDPEGEPIGTYDRFPEVLDPSRDGVLEIYWGEPFPTDQEGAVTVSIEYDVGVVYETPVSLDFDLTSVPVGR